MSQTFSIFRHRIYPMSREDTLQLFEFERFLFDRVFPRVGQALSRKGSVEPFPAGGSRRPALKAKASMCQGHRREVFQRNYRRKSQSTDNFCEISSECL